MIKNARCRDHGGCNAIYKEEMLWRLAAGALEEKRNHQAEVSEYMLMTV